MPAAITRQANTSEPTMVRTLVPLGALLACLASGEASAAIDNSDVLDSVLDRYNAAASGWASVIVGYATTLFWTLATISLVWTFGTMALRKADVAEFFAEFVKFTVTTGFFLWILINGPGFATSLITSLRQIGGDATGLGPSLTPSGVVDIGFAIFDKVVENSSVWEPTDSLVGMLIAGIILVLLALIGINMLLLLITGWVLAYGAVFFLGFGGSRWTSDFAINYFKNVLALAAQLLAMVLLVGIGKTFLDDYYNSMSNGISLKEMGVMLIVSLTLYALVNKVPAVIGSVVTGSSAGAGGGVTAGAVFGGALGATAALAGAGSLAASAAVSAAANVAGGSQALMAAIQAGASASAAGGTENTPQITGNSTPSANGSGGLSAAMGDPQAPTPLGGSGPTGQGDPPPANKDTGGEQSRQSGTSSAAGALAHGVGDVMAGKMSDMKEAAQERIAATPGGKVAAAINARADKSEDMPDVSGLAPEIAEFVTGHKS